MVTEAQVVLAIFVLSFALILSEVVHRTIAAWFGSVLMLLYGHYTGVFHLHEQYNAAGELVKTYTLEHTMLGWIEWEVIGLLLGMMIFASILELCGFFEYVAIKAAKMSKGDPWRLIVLLGTFTTLLSLVIDNVTAIIIIAPVTLRICNKLEINPVPPLLAEAILSDTGGVASMVGHIWPIFSGFRGGKGVAPGWSGLFPLSPICGIVATIVGVPIIILTRYVSLGSIIGAISGTGLLVVLSLAGQTSGVYAWYGFLGGIIVIARHKDNLSRLVKGNERRLDIPKGIPTIR